MEPTRSIHTFLDTLASRLRRQARLTALFYCTAFVVFLAIVAPLIAYLGDLDRRTGYLVLALALAAPALAVGWLLLPGQRWQERKASARYVGDRYESLRSDLLSSLELMESQKSGGSPELKEALWATTAARIGELRLQALAPSQRLKLPMTAAGFSFCLVLAALLIVPRPLGQGFKLLMTAPPVEPFSGATLSAQPLVGDVEVLVEFPAYTGRPALQLPASSGDFEVMPGSTIQITTKALGPVKRAAILLSSDRGDDVEESIELDVSGPRLRGSFSLTEATYYRFELDDGGDRRVEARARRIDMQADKAPKVELYAPAEELDVAKVKRVELAYLAEDDYGVDKLELVYKSKQGDGRIPLSLSAAPSNRAPGAGPGVRSVQNNYLWDLSELPIQPGTQVEYFVEAFDNDEVNGPKSTRSRSYYLRLFSPRERHEGLLGRQEVLANKFLDLLANRLTVPPQGLAEHRAIQRTAADLVVELGSLVAALKADEMTSPDLHTALEALRSRVDKRTRNEGELLSELEDKARKSLASDLPWDKLGNSDRYIISELEEDVLSMADWLARQRLENVLAIDDEIKASRARIDKLMEEYERSGDPEVLAEIERELRALEKRLAERAKQSMQMPEDVLDRFVNRDALEMQHEKSCIAQVRELLAAGDAKAATAKMKECDELMEMSSGSLEDSLQALRSETFSEQEKAFSEMSNELRDLSQDQEDIARAAERLYQRYAEEASKQKDDKSGDAKRRAGELLSKLERKLQQLPRDGLTPFAKEELDILKGRLEDTRQMLQRGELFEALSMARHSESSLETLQAELEASLDEAWSRQAQSAEKGARKALPLARQLVDELEKATPSPGEIMSSSDKQELDKLRRRQKSVRQRSQNLLKKLDEAAETMPGESGKVMQEGITEAMEAMKKAEAQFRARQPSKGREQAKRAAERLQKTGDRSRSAARMGQNSGQVNMRDEPVRIPGADEYKAPEKFREEILEAMDEESAPSSFSEQVKQYYKDIMK